MKKFASLVLLSAVTLGITCSDVAMAARPESSASIAVSKNNLNNQNKSIKKCKKAAYDGIIPCNEAQDKDVDVLNKERNIEAKSAISESKQAVTKNETVNSCGKNKSILNKLTGTTGVAVAGTVSILIGSSLLLVQNKKISGKSRKGKKS